jgi:serine/threonine protein kinase
MNELDSLATQQTFAPGNILFGRYKLVRLIARGSRGDLWEALDQRLQLDVALKILIGYAHQADLVRGGARAMDLTHPNIVRTYDVLEEGSIVAVVTELVRGKSLATWFREKDPSWCSAGEIKRWAEDLFAALEFAWGHCRQVHGDIRLANLIIGHNSALKVIDFPFAGVREGKNLLELNADATAGLSLPTLSPQIIAGEPATHADDLYAAAAIFYELLTGKPVFPGGNVIAQIERKMPPTIAARRLEHGIQTPPLPEAWEQWLALCLAKDRSARPQRASEVLPLIQQVDTVQLPSVPPLATRTGPTRLGTAIQSLQPKSGWRAVFTSPIGRSVLLAAAALLAFQFGIRGPNQAMLAERREFITALTAADLQVPTEPAASALSADWAALVTASKSRQTEWTQFADEIELEPLSFTSEDERQLISARRKINEWQTRTSEAEDRQARLVAAEDAKIGELKTAILKNERDEKDLATDVEKLDLWKRLLDTSQDERLASLPEYKNALDRVAKTVSALQARIAQEEDDTRKMKETEEKKKQEMAVEAASKAEQWLANAIQQRADAQTLSQDQAIGASAKVARWKTFLDALEKPPEGADPVRLRELKAQGAAEHITWLAKANEETPKEPLSLIAIFANATLFKDLQEPEKRVILKKAQEALVTAGTYKGKPDGTPGPGTHTSLVEYQKQKQLIASGALDDSTTEVLGLDTTDLAAVKEEAKKLAASPPSNGGGSKGKSGGRGSSSKPPPKSIYDVTGGKMRELKDRAFGTINQAEWQKHLRYLRWEENQ